MAVGDETKVAEGAGSGTAAAGQPAEGAAAQAGSKPGLPAPAASSAGTEPAKEPKRHKLSDDGEIPEDADLIEMTPRAFKSRMSRASKADLKKRFGTDDLDQIKKDMDELASLRKDKKDRELAAMTELDREKKLREEAEGRATKAETRARQVQEDRIFDREEHHLVRLFSKHIDEDYVDQELTGFARHLTKNFSKKQLEKMSDKQRDAEAAKYCEERLKAKPKLGKDYETSAAAKIEKDLKDRARGKAPVTNGASPDKKKPAEGGSQPKNFAPGKGASYADIKAAGFSYK